MVTQQTDDTKLDPEPQQGLDEGQEGISRTDTEGAREASISGDRKAQNESDDITSGATETAETTGLFPQKSPDELATLRAENARLAQEASAQQAAQQQQRIANVAMAYRQHLTEQYVEQGYDEQVATQLATSETRAQVSEYIAKQSHLRATALELSQEHKIPRAELEQFQDEAGMRQFAKVYSRTSGPEAKRIEALEKQVAQLLKGRVPVQKYDQGGKSKGKSAYLEWLNNGGPRPSSAEIDRMNASYLT